MSSPEISHDPSRHLFEIHLEGQVAHLEYRLDGALMTITHTIVPPALGGRGLGGRLVDAALVHAAASGLEVQSECSYASHRMARRAARASSGDGD